MKTGKVKNPWPNVDAINGALFHHFGITETSFYTVFFAVALALGFSAQYVLNRALGTPITRPRSVTTEWIKDKTTE
jgi:citrate synthase